MTEVEVRNDESSPKKKARWKRALRAIGLLIVGALIGLLVGSIHHFSDIPPVDISQYYGVARGLDAEGRFCIDNSQEGMRCAIPRLRGDQELPLEGSPVRGGYAELPSDTSDLPEPSWLWITPVGCGSRGTEEATRCPED